MHSIEWWHCAANRTRSSAIAEGPRDASCQLKSREFSDAKDLRKFRPGSPPAGAPNAGGVGKNQRLCTNSWLYLENGTR